MSTLAGSLLADKTGLNIVQLDAINVSTWI
jgi:hypothetical protein